MRLLISGICGFVGAALARALLDSRSDLTIAGFDNFSRPGSPTNVGDLKRRGVRLFHGDARAASDFETLPEADWVIDCAANPSVLAGVDGRTSSRQLIEHNLGGTVNLLEYCKRYRAGLILLSTSRVYSIAALAALSVEVKGDAFAPMAEGGPLPAGVTADGISEAFSTAAPVSLYGASKLASEALALEYADAFGFPCFVNRCGVLAGAGQFGRPDQGIFAYWIHSWARRRPLRYIGFGGAGYQVRDCLHPADLVPLIEAQMKDGSPGDRIFHAGGGVASALSLAQLSAWCAARFGPHVVAADPRERPFDIPWVVLDSARAARAWGWRPRRTAASILEEIAAHADREPAWLDLSGPL